MGRSYKKDFDSFGEFLCAVYTAAPGVGDPRGHDLRLDMSAAATGLGTKFPSDGGFLVPETFADGVWTAVYDTGQIISRCRRQVITNSRGATIPAIDESSRATGSRYGGIRTYWADEAATVTATRPKYRSIKLQANKLMSLSYATEELVADMPAFAAFLERAFTEEATFEVEDQIINGTGAGRPLGIKNSNAVIEVAKESGQAASTVQAANFTNMYSRLWGASRSRAVWMINPDIWPQIADDQLANGQSLITYSGDGTPRIFGREIIQPEQCSTLGSPGDVILADLSQVLVGEEAPDFLSSIHVRFLFDEAIFKFTWRVDAQPAWTSPVTPLNSSTTQSPLITLAVRA